MNHGLTISMAGLIGCCVLFEAAHEVCFKLAAKEAALSAAIMKPWTWLGILFWAIELVAWTLVLDKVALSIAFPLMALSYVAIVVAGAVILKESVNLRHAVGAFLITAGVACVGATGL